MLDVVVETFKNHEQLIWLLGIGSVVLLVGTALLIPWLIIILPADFFARKLGSPEAQSSRSRMSTIVLAVCRNLIGAVLLVAGFIMLFVPGQGLLTILVALALIDFPGKRILLLRMISSPRVFNAANGIRRWAGKPELLAAETPPRGGRSPQRTGGSMPRD